MVARTKGTKGKSREEFEKYNLDEIESDGIACLSKSIIEIIQDNFYCGTEFGKEHELQINEEALEEAIISDAFRDCKLISSMDTIYKNFGYTYQGENSSLESVLASIEMQI